VKLQEMSIYTAKKARFMRALLLGESVKDSAKLAGISERTAFYWLKDERFQAEKKRCQAELFNASMEEIIRLNIASIQQSYNERYRR
jgi:phage terminase small subunit